MHPQNTLVFAHGGDDPHHDRDGSHSVFALVDL